MVSITAGGLTTQFIYDGDGNLIKKIKTDGSKTLYVGGIYEVDKNSGGTVVNTKTYYPAAGAIRNGSTLYYVVSTGSTRRLKDHLGSASVVTNSSGTIVGEDRFYPFGETRFTTGTMFTDKLYTGQREMAGLGVYHYGARFYSPKLGRFLSADTIVPGYANPQNLNRYSYVINNPLRYTDPTGHVACRTQEECQDMGTTPGGGSPKPKPKPKKKDKDDGEGGNADLLVQRHECLVGCRWPGPNEASFEALTNFFDFDNMASDVWDTLNSPLSGVGPAFVFCSSGNCDPNVVDGLTDIVVSRVPEFINFINEGYNPPPTVQPTPFLSPTADPTTTLSTPSITATLSMTPTPTFTVTPSLTPTFPTSIPTSVSTPVYWVP